MNINELWAQLFGKGSLLNRILETLLKIQASLQKIEQGNTPWQRDTTERLQAIKDQLDRIEEEIVGSEAATLIITVGEPTEQ